MLLTRVINESWDAWQEPSYESDSLFQGQTELLSHASQSALVLRTVGQVGNIHPLRQRPEAGSSHNQGSHAAVKVFKKYWIVKIGLQDLEEVLKLAKMYINYWQSIEILNSSICLFKFCSLPPRALQLFLCIVFHEWNFQKWRQVFLKECTVNPAQRIDTPFPWIFHMRQGWCSFYPTPTKSIQFFKAV